MLPFLAAAGAASVFGHIVEGISAFEMGQLTNAEAKMNAGLIIGEKVKDLKMLAEAQDARRSQAKAHFAAGGIDVNSGSAFEFDLAQSRIDARLRSRQMFQAELQARQTRFQGKMAKYQGKMKLFNSVLSAFGSAGQVAAVGMGGTPSTTTPAAPAAPATGGK